MLGGPPEARRAAPGTPHASGKRVGRVGSRLCARAYGRGRSSGTRALRSASRHVPDPTLGQDTERPEELLWRRRQAAIRLEAEEVRLPAPEPRRSSPSPPRAVCA